MLLCFSKGLSSITLVRPLDSASATAAARPKHAFTTVALRPGMTSLRRFGEPGACCLRQLRNGNVDRSGRQLVRLLRRSRDLGRAAFHGFDGTEIIRRLVAGCFRTALRSFGRHWSTTQIRFRWRTLFHGGDVARNLDLATSMARFLTPVSSVGYMTDLLSRRQ